VSVAVGRRDPALGVAWRFAALGGVTVGLALSPAASADAGGAGALALAVGGAGALGALAPRRRGPAAIAWLAAIAFAAGIAGLVGGAARLEAIDGGAAHLALGERMEVTGYLTAVPRRDDGSVDLRLETPDGRLLVEAREPLGDVQVGQALRAVGVVRAPSDFEAPYLERLGIATVLDAERLELLRARRGGLVGLLDGVRSRAERALSEGTPDASAALLRGFVLGQDDRIAPGVVDDFKRSGLAHLLAVSGQNVVLLAVLAAAILGAVGVPIRARLVTILLLIAVYVPVTGAGPSIQRAGVMGAAGVVAALADRPRSRWYALLLAAAVTLALDPRASADVGWQLSFAAVLGILLFAAPLASALAGNRPGRARSALAEGAGLTISATLATAPLIAFHFGTLSLVTLPANLLAAPAEAPVMWLGMLAAAAGQLPWLPTEPITWLAGLLAAYVGQIARWLGRPGWAQAELELGGPELAAVCAVLVAGTALVLRLVGRRRGLAVSRARGAAAVAIAGGVLAAAALAPVPFAATPGALAAPDLRVRVLDVGEGSATLLEPSAGAPVLVDAGPADAAVAERLAALGIDRLAALVVSHGDSDHSGGLPAVLESVAVDRLLYAHIDAGLAELAGARGARPARIAAGSRLRVGRLRLQVLWPPRRLEVPRGEPNAASVALMADLGRFELLLPGDAEAELAPIHPGDIDVLVVAHHGSADAGLKALLFEADPELAAISVGASNPYGHPAPETLDALAAAGVPVRRTDLGGEIVIEVKGSRWVVL